jgi:hypothetical protein
MASSGPEANQSIVTFNSTAFNHTERKSYFINDCCFGDDLARWMIAELTKQGVRTIGDADQEDFGWYLTFEIGHSKYFFLTSYRADDISVGATWIGFIERVCSPLGRMFGRQNHNISPEAPQAIHRILSSSPKIRGIQWHRTEDSY